MGYTVHVIVQARILEWVAFPFSRGSSQPRDWTQVSHITVGFFTSWTTGEALSDVKGKRNQSQLCLHLDDGNQAHALSCLIWPVAELIPGWDFSYLVLTWPQRLLKCLQLNHQSIKIILQPSSDPEAFLLHPCPPYQCFLHSGFGHHIWNLIYRKYFWLPNHDFFPIYNWVKWRRFCQP